MAYYVGLDAEQMAVLRQIVEHERELSLRRRSGWLKDRVAYQAMLRDIANLLDAAMEAS